MSEAFTRDGSPLECSGAFATGCQGRLEPMRRR